MSNGDDVLDNWEEIDEAGINTLKPAPATTCERITNSTQPNVNLATSAAAAAIHLSRPSQMKLLQRSNTEESTVTSSTSSNQLIKSPLDEMSATFQPVLMVLHKPQDEYQSANYTAPIANQTVKILRRPTQSTEIRNNGIRPKQPIKTLQQREQEYAEARLRILGSAKNPEDEEQRTSTTTTTSIVTSTTNSTVATTPTSTSLAGSLNNAVTNMVTSAKNTSPKIQIAANQYNNHFNQQQKYQQNYQQQQQQQQQQNYYYNQQQQQQQSQSPAYNNNRTYNINPLLALGPMGPIGQPAQYQNPALSSPQAQQHFKYQQYHQKSPQQQHKTQQQQQQQQTWSPVVGGSVSSSSIRQQQTNDTILRLPRGPDGSTGFQMRR